MYIGKCRGRNEQDCCHVGFQCFKYNAANWGGDGEDFTFDMDIHVRFYLTSTESCPNGKLKQRLQ